MRALDLNLRSGVSDHLATAGRQPGRDVSEIDATKEAARLRLAEVAGQSAEVVAADRSVRGLRR